MAELSLFSLANLPFSVTREDLVAEKQANVSLKCLFVQVLPTELEKDRSWGYFEPKSMLVKGCVPHMRILLVIQFISRRSQLSCAETGTQ